MSFAVVSRIVPDEAVGRWVLQDLSRFQRRSCKAYSSGPILVAGGIQFGLLLRLGGKDLDFASDLQVYAVNLSARRTMGQHTIKLVNQARGREFDVLLSGEAGLWEPKSEWGWKQAVSLEVLEDSEAGFVVDDTLILELNMQVWEAEAVRTQGVPLCIARPGASLLPSSNPTPTPSSAPTAVPPPSTSSSSSSGSRFVPPAPAPASAGGAAIVAPPSASASNSSSAVMMRPSLIPPHSNTASATNPAATAHTVPPPAPPSLASGPGASAIPTQSLNSNQPHIPVHVAAIRPTSISHSGGPWVRSGIPSSKTCSLNADFSELLSTGRGADLTVTWTGLDTCAAGHCHCLPEFGDVNEEGEAAEYQSIRAHRLVLGTRSPVLERLLVSSGLAESKSDSNYDTLVLDGADSRIATWFIRFLYTDEVAAEAWEDQESLCFLLALAHKYQVQALVEQCLARLVEQLSEETAAERLMLADLLDAPALKASVIDFVTASHRRLARVQATEGWQRLTKSRPQLLADILAAVVPPNVKRARVDEK